MALRSAHLDERTFREMWRDYAWARGHTKRLVLAFEQWWFSREWKWERPNTSPNTRAARRLRKVKDG